MGFRLRMQGMSKIMVDSPRGLWSNRTMRSENNHLPVFSRASGETVVERPWLIHLGLIHLGLIHLGPMRLSLLSLASLLALILIIGRVAGSG
jgi:hypothetical protein